jgi:hypothetical protein
LAGGSVCHPGFCATPAAAPPRHAATANPANRRLKDPIRILQLDAELWIAP